MTSGEPRVPITAPEDAHLVKLSFCSPGVPDTEETGLNATSWPGGRYPVDVQLAGLATRLWDADDPRLTATCCTTRGKFCERDDASLRLREAGESVSGNDDIRTKPGFGESDAWLSPEDTRGIKPGGFGESDE